ncbi:thiolase family protein [Acrocarpospora catenulata]|uniref:thiolase family protein n=1 Tax=Acrocarpospora catenulata TaxID=2836182 RepID=UPI001BD9EAD6|nr:thiolase family protein [Acrocarpospora catenulata]
MAQPISDQIAIAGVFSAPYTRSRGMTALAMVTEACVGALRDAGLGPCDVDGLSGSQLVHSNTLQAALGVPEITWWCNQRIPVYHQLFEAMYAVWSGAATTVLVYHVTYRAPGVSRSAAADPFRRRFGLGTNVPNANPDAAVNAVGYATWAGRYLHDYGLDRTTFGMVAVNGRSNALLNEHAAMREPLTMDDYLAARMLREPLTMLDMDLPVDGADAFVVTSTERARDLPRRPVTIHAASMGQARVNNEEQLVDLDHTGQQIAAAAMWSRSDATLRDIDVFLPYDGFSIIETRWFEVIGYCGPGEAYDFMKHHWNTERERIEIDGRVLVNPHGGSLADGGTQGSGHFREAVLQLRGEASEGRQVPGATTALVTSGGFFFNSAAAVLRADEG